MQAPTAPDNDELVLPPRLVAFGDALARLAERLRTCLAAPQTTGPEYPLRQHIDILERAVTRITLHLVASDADVLANPAATEADAYRAVALFEAEIEQLLAGWTTAAQVVAPPFTMDARRLLPAAYTHTLREILAWIDNLVPVIATPRATLEARGLWKEGQSEQTFETCLTLTAAPALEELNARIERRAVRNRLPAPAKPGKTVPLHTPANLFSAYRAPMQTPSPGWIKAIPGFVMLVILIVLLVFSPVYFGIVLLMLIVVALLDGLVKRPGLLLTLLGLGALFSLFGGDDDCDCDL